MNVVGVEQRVNVAILTLPSPRVANENFPKTNLLSQKNVRYLRDHSDCYTEKKNMDLFDSDLFGILLLHPATPPPSLHEICYCHCII